MADQHPITPPDELLEHWCAVGKSGNWQNALALAYRAGADQKLEACVALVNDWAQRLGYPHYGAELRAARRPKPPSLKEQAHDAVNEISDCMSAGFVPKRSNLDVIRRALEALPND